ncbi:MAG: hypothetical protein AMS21_00825 [Gemmatimonas sp. SG8_38_2]|nr:MAG: hypothetical protein AMS21_00825 [Gemmatimonas sp. SG8_38_2]
MRPFRFLGPGMHRFMHDLRLPLVSPAQALEQQASFRLPAVRQVLNFGFFGMAYRSFRQKRSLVLGTRNRALVHFLMQETPASGHFVLQLFAPFFGMRVKPLFVPF